MPVASPCWVHQLAWLAYQIQYTTRSTMSSNDSRMALWVVTNRGLRAEPARQQDGDRAEKGAPPDRMRSPEASAFLHS